MIKMDFAKLAKRPRWWRNLALRLFWPASIMIHGGELNPYGSYCVISRQGLWVGTLDWYVGETAKAHHDKEVTDLYAEIARRDARIAWLEKEAAE